jgi:hypothetical protein
MVLQDGDMSSDSFNENPADNDAYSSSSAPRSNRLDTSQLPRPLPLIGPLLGMSEESRRTKAEATIKYAEQSLNRQMTYEEAQAFATHLFRIDQFCSYTGAVGVAWGTWKWYRTMDMGRYPFYQPKPESINPNKFLIIRGPYANYARQSFRLGVYQLVAAEIMKLVGTLVAQPVAARDTAADPLLANFKVDLMKVMESRKEEQRSQIEHRRNESYRRQGQNPDGSPIKELPPHAGAPRPWAGARKAPTPPTPIPTPEDDMSPSAGSGESWYGESNPPSDYTRDNQPSQKSTQSATSKSPRERQPTRPADDDDTSPTGGMFQDDVQNQSGRPGESSWERLRRGGAPLPGQRPPPRKYDPPREEQRQGSTLGDSFAFAETDEQRQRGQERAQREFDQRLERERQGKDFNDERRW